ncbi:hypothetical protein HMI54_010982 [Coelomomyces lativittatus]|nr:hypothetical protein HMI54_010982 [Coelomomyces lativittatus]KAJ1507772.1 hypothetical protein HMI56_007625 [Coelomomyces lativittatus]
MTFAHNLVILAILGLGSRFVNGHGHLLESFTGFADFRVNQGGVNECGLVTLQAIAHAMNQTTPVPVVLGQNRTFQYQITNNDGAGGLTVAFDETGVGNAFNKRGTVVVQPPGNGGNLAGVVNPQTHPVTITIPSNLQCSNAKKICIMQVKQAQQFGSCVFVTPQAAAPSPPPPSPVTAQTPPFSFPLSASASAGSTSQPFQNSSVSSATLENANSGLGNSAFGLSVNGQSAFGQVPDSFGLAFSRFFRFP